MTLRIETMAGCPTGVTLDWNLHTNFVARGAQRTGWFPDWPACQFSYCPAMGIIVHQMDRSGWVKWDFIVVVVMKPHYTAVALLQFTTTPEVHDRQERVTRTQLHITNEAEN